MSKKENKNGHRLARQARAGGQKLKNLIEHHYSRKCLYTSSGKSKEKLSRRQGTSNE